jgi:2-methylcitrate dehydratase PrpD
MTTQARMKVNNRIIDTAAAAAAAAAANVYVIVLLSCRCLLTQLLLGVLQRQFQSVRSSYTFIRKYLN